MRRPICSIRSQSLRLIQPGPAVCGSAVFHFQMRDGVDEEEADQAVPQEGTQHLRTHLLLSSHTRASLATLSTPVSCSFNL